MKKKLFSIVGAVLTMVAVLTFVYVKDNANNNNEIFNANVDALADEEDFAPDGSTICYYESKVKVGHTYYDCQTCTKIYNEKGKGTYTKCFK